MRAPSPYDFSVAFDDICGGGVDDRRRVYPDEAVRAAREIARHVHRRRVASPMRIDVVGYDSTPWTFQVLGAGYEPKYLQTDIADVAYQIIGAVRFPIFEDLRRRFRVMIPRPKLVRLDGEESYAAFRDARRQPYIARLESRLATLEAAYRGHVSDGHGGDQELLELDFDRAVSGDRDLVDEELAQDVVGTLCEVAIGGSRVRLPLPDWAEGKVECWQDGGEILCTVRLPAPGGGVALATTAAPLDRHLEEVVEGAMSAGVDADVLGEIGVPVARALCGASLVPELCRAASALLKRPEARSGRAFVGTMSSTADADLAATMALLQKCQRGDDGAIGEVREMSSTSVGMLLADAGECLARAQRDAVRGRL
jgi:hypothetical protein